MKGAVSECIVDVDNQLPVSGHLIVEQRLYAAGREEQLSVLSGMCQLGQRTCHVCHHLQTHRSLPTCPIFEQSAAITPKRYQIGCQLVLATNRKSHTDFRLMTLNDLERRNSPYSACFSPNSIALLANYVTVVEDRPIMSVKYYLPVAVFHFWP